MNQDLMNWLTADGTEEKISDGTGLLLAPISSNQPLLIEKIEKNLEPDQNLNIKEEEKEEKKENIDNNFENDINENNINNENENILSDNNQVEQVEELSSEIRELHDTVKKLQNSIPIEKEEEQHQINDTEIEIDLDEGTNIKKAWQEKAADFDLSLDEPPPELWTRISEGDEDEEDDEIDYEQGVSLQGAAYIQKREQRTNFTERLHNTLKWRKQKAEQLKEEEEEKKDHHPYRSRSLIICSTMLMILGAAFLALFFIQQWTPEKINARASKKFENGDYEGAMNLYQRAYKRYPNILIFLTGIAKSAEKAGHLQTASAAWEAYINSLPKDDAKNLRLARRELRRLNKKNEPNEIKHEEKKEEIQTPQNDIKQEENKEKEEEKKEEITETKKTEAVIPVSFDDFLKEGNNAYNLRLYNTAIIYFSRAMELNGSDIRSYIGLARAYMAKEMYFDSKRIIDEAKRKFKRNSTIEVELQELKMK